MQAGVDQRRRPERETEGHGRGEAEVRVLAGQGPKGHIAERQTSDAGEAEEDELRTGEGRVDEAVHEACGNDGDDGDDEQGKDAHEISILKKDEPDGNVQHIHYTTYS